MSAPSPSAAAWRPSSSTGRSATWPRRASARFPILARGVIPIPGAKDTLGALGGPVRVGGVEVRPGDIVVGDEEGIVVVPAARAAAILGAARTRADKDAATTLDAWEKAHSARIEETLRQKGFTG